MLGLGGDDLLGIGGSDDVLGIGKEGIPEDYSEVTIDSPGLYYRAAALEHEPLAYWPLDESPSVQARDVSGNGRHLDYDDADPQTVDWRAFSGEAAAIPHGGAVLFVGGSGASPGLSGVTLPTIGSEFTVAGFIRRASGGTQPARQRVWQAASGIHLDIVGSQVRLTMEGETINSAPGAVDDTDWHHVAVVRTSTGIQLWLDGNISGIGLPADGANAPLDGAPGAWPSRTPGPCGWRWTSGASGRRRSSRRSCTPAGGIGGSLGGYAFGVKTTLHPGGRGDRHVTIPCTGYGIILDRTFITSRLATASNATAREVLADAFELAGITDDDFTLGGVEIDDVVGRGVHNISVSQTSPGRWLRFTNGVPWVDPVRELQLVRRTQVEQSPLVLDGTNVQAAAISGKPTALRLPRRADWGAAVRHVGGSVYRRRNH